MIEAVRFCGESLVSGVRANRTHQSSTINAVIYITIRHCHIGVFLHVGLIATTINTLANRETLKACGVRMVHLSIRRIVVLYRSHQRADVHIGVTRHLSLITTTEHIASYFGT